MTNIVTYPTNPVQGQEFTVGETIKIWDGEKWVNKTPTNNPHNVTKDQVGLGDVDNVSAANLRDRSTHTGTQPLSTISDAGSAASKDVGVSNGVASLDGSGKVPDSESQVSSVSGKKGDVELNLSDIKVNGGTANNVVKAQLISQGLSGNYGFFEEGFNYTLEGDIGIDADGNSWIYVGSGAPNKVVAAGTVPSVGAGYEQVTFNSLQQLGGLDQASGLDRVYSRKILSIKDLASANPTDMDELNVVSYHEGWAAINSTPRGGGKFIWDANRSKASHDGGHVIDPDRPFPTDWTDETQKENWFTAATTGSGCFVRVGVMRRRSSEYGQFGDNNVDDSKAINKMLESASGGKAFIDKQSNGAIRAHLLFINANTRLEFEPSTVVKTPLSHPSEAITRHLYVRNADNVTIVGNGARFEMDAITYTGDSAHGLQIFESDNVQLDDLHFYDSKGDGIYVGGVAKKSTRIKMTRITCDKQRRNGMSVVHVDGMYVSDSRFLNSSGINPQYGVDVEPNGTDTVENVTFQRCTAHNNQGTGFGVIAKSINVTFRDCITYDNGAVGFGSTALVSNTRRPRLIKFINCKSERDSTGLYVQGSDDISTEAHEVSNSLSNGMQVLASSGVKVNGGFVRGATGRGVSIQDGLDATLVSNLEISSCTDVGIYASTLRLDIDKCSIFGNATSPTPVAKANVYVFKGYLRMINNTIRKGDSANTPDYGVKLRNTSSVKVYFQGNDMETSGSTASVDVGVLPSLINAGNINNDGTYSTTFN